MIASVKGKIEIKSINYIVVDVNGIGYKIYMPETSIQNLEEGKEIKVYTYLRITQDDMSLYGFLSNEELVMFELLISVGGIGAKSATNILSNIEPSKFAMAVITNDINTIKSLPGIGPKTAQRIILELKDKIKTEQAIEGATAEKVSGTDNQKMQDVIDALQVLGYNHRSAEIAVSKLQNKDLPLEELIKDSLNILSK